MRGWQVATALGCGLVLSADLVVVAARYDGPVEVAERPAPKAGSSSPIPTPSPSPAPRPKPPVRLVFSVVASNATRVMSVTAAGQGTRAEPHRPPAPGHAVSYATGRFVTSKVLGSNEFHGCGIAGCSTTRYTEAGIAIGDIGRPATRQLTKGGYDTDPSFAPDGTVIAYLSHIRRPDGRETDVIVIVTPDGEQIGSFTAPGTGTYAAPVWSPQGKHIAAVERTVVKGKSRARVVLVDVDTGRSRPLGQGEFDQLAWAPNGTFLVARGAVTGSYGGTPATTGHDLWVVPVSGAAPRRLTRHAPTTFQGTERSTYYCDTYAHYVGVKDPVVSPDSRSVVFATNLPHRRRAGRAWDLHAVNVDGTGSRTVWRAPAPSCGGSMTVRETTATPLGWLV